MHSQYVYAPRTNGSEHGTVFTNPMVVEYMLDILGYRSDRNLKGIKILDPAAGDGVFIEQILKRLFESSEIYSFDFEKALENITAVEINPSTARELASNIIGILSKFGVENAYHIADSMVIIEDFLLVTGSQLGYDLDIVVGNPPYIRHERIPEDKKNTYRQLFHTFRHRSDMYVAFFEKGLSILGTNGKLCYICSNRWMKTKYGASLRDLVSNNYGLDLVLDIQDKAAFHEEVDAYASVTMLSKTRPSLFKRGTVSDINTIHALGKADFADTAQPTDGDWRFEYKTDHSAFPVASIEDQGFKIGIGVATGADRIFIGSRANLPVEDEILLPLITSREIKDGSIVSKGKMLLNPYDKAGKLIDLDHYPKAKKYLESHYNVLSARHTARANKTKWYKTIDRVYNDLVSTPKILIPDLKKDALFPIDEGAYYPHHNIYYISHDDIDMLKVLAAILSSSFVYRQISSISVLMRGGYPRWQSQNLRKLSIPVINKIPVNLRERLIKARDTSDIKGIDSAMDQLFGERARID